MTVGLFGSKVVCSSLLNRSYLRIHPLTFVVEGDFWKTIDFSSCSIYVIFHSILKRLVFEYTRESKSPLLRQMSLTVAKTDRVGLTSTTTLNVITIQKRRLVDSISTVWNEKTIYIGTSDPAARHQTIEAANPPVR